MGPTWVLSAPDGSHVGPMNLAIRDIAARSNCPGCIQAHWPHSTVREWSEPHQQWPAWLPSVSLGADWIQLGSVTTNLNNRLTGAKFTGGTDSRSAGTGPSQMLSILTAGSLGCPSPLPNCFEKHLKHMPLIWQNTKQGIQNFVQCWKRLVTFKQTECFVFWGVCRHVVSHAEFTCPSCSFLVTNNVNKSWHSPTKLVSKVNKEVLCLWKYTHKKLGFSLSG